MKRLPIEHAKIYEEFIQEQFLVETNYDNFNAVAADMEQEQTMQRSQKNSTKIKRQTKQIDFISE